MKREGDFASLLQGGGDTQRDATLAWRERRDCLLSESCVWVYACMSVHKCTCVSVHAWESVCASERVCLCVWHQVWWSVMGKEGDVKTTLARPTGPTEQPLIREPELVGRRTWREGFKHIHLLENEWRKNQADRKDGHELAEGTKETLGNSRVRRHPPHQPSPEYGYYAGLSVCLGSKQTTFFQNFQRQKDGNFNRSQHQHLSVIKTCVNHGSERQGVKGGYKWASVLLGCCTFLGIWNLKKKIFFSSKPENRCMMLFWNFMPRTGSSD